MRFSSLTLSLSPSREEDRQRIQDQLRLAMLAEELGFHGLWLTEHYFTGESVYNDPLAFAAAIAMKTERLRIGFAVVQMPFHHPVQLATQLALLDNLSDGRIDVGIGKGTVYNEFEFMGYGLRSDDSRARMDEAMEIFRRVWTEAPLTFEGEYFRVAVPELRPAPVQRPHPPLWRSAISASSFSECGRLGLPILTARLPVDAIAGRWALYREGMTEAGLPTDVQEALLKQSGVWRNVWVADSDAQAEDELSHWLTETREHMMHVRAELNPPDFQIDPAVLNPWSDPAMEHGVGVKSVLESGSIYGSPDTVRGEIEALRDAGVGHLVCQTAFGDMDYAACSRVMERFGREVMPAFTN